MTIDEFISSTKALELEWYIEERGTIRCAKGDCPISALSRFINPEIGWSPDTMNEQFLTNAALLGLSKIDAYHIVNAADGEGAFQEDLRARLISELNAHFLSPTG